jgi:hypothetical protein
MGLPRAGRPRNDTEDHGKGDGIVLVLSAAVLVIVIEARDAGRSGWRAVGISRRRGGTEVLLASGGPQKARIPRKGSALSVKYQLRQRLGREPTGLLAPGGGVTVISRWSRIAPPEILPPAHRSRRDRIGWLRGCSVFHDARSNQGHQHSSTYTSVIDMLKLC